MREREGAEESEKGGEERRDESKREMRDSGERRRDEGTERRDEGQWGEERAGFQSSFNLLNTDSEAQPTASCFPAKSAQGLPA
ncbi:UNVERIFIED_CONTAM: hypothetical protein FKN15_018081 [Acipenser sinensis]